MKLIRYVGVFKSAEGDVYKLTVHCNGFLQAFFLLTADAIRQAKHYQLHLITDEAGNERKIGDILECSSLIKP